MRKQRERRDGVEGGGNILVGGLVWWLMGWDWSLGAADIVMWWLMVEIEDGSLMYLENNDLCLGPTQAGRGAAVKGLWLDRSALRLWGISRSAQQGTRQVSVFRWENSGQKGGFLTLKDLSLELRFRRKS